jgi:hypothetical protein
MRLGDVRLPDEEVAPLRVGLSMTPFFLSSWSYVSCAITSSESSIRTSV